MTKSKLRGDETKTTKLMAGGDDEAYGEEEEDGEGGGAAEWRRSKRDLGLAFFWFSCSFSILV